MSTATAPATDTLEDLDFEPRCEHSQHNSPGWRHQHEGPATHWFQVIHDGPGHDQVPYMGCEGWRRHVLSKYEGIWHCACGAQGPGREMVIMLGPIK